MKASHNVVSSARRFSSWLIAGLGLAAYVGLVYGLTLLPVQLEVPLPRWGARVVPPVVYGLLVLLFVRRPSVVRWLMGTAVLSGLHVLLEQAREPLTALVDPALAGHPLVWMLPPPFPELVGVTLLLVPLRDVLRARPRAASERTPGPARAGSTARSRAGAPVRPQPAGPGEGASPSGEVLAAPRAAPTAEPVMPEASLGVPSPTVQSTEGLTRRRQAPRVESSREAAAASPGRRSSLVLRIALDRVIGQLPPGTFLAPEDEVASSLSDPGYLRIPGQLVVTQLGEGVARVAWADVVDQFPPHLVGLGSGEISEHLGDGLRLPLDEVVGQMGHELFMSDVPEVKIPGLDRIPVPFHPTGESGPGPSVQAERAAEIASPPWENVSAAATRTPRPKEPVGIAHETPPDATPPPAVVRSAAAPPRVEGPLSERSEPVRRPEPGPAEPGLSPHMDGPTVRIPFGRIAPEIPADVFRAPLEEVEGRMLEPGLLVVPLSTVLPQLAEGLIRVGWDVIGAQFPSALLAVSEAEMRERLPSGLRLPLDEVIQQVPPDMFMASGPAADVRGLESFPAPFQPLVSDPSPAPALVTNRAEVPEAVGEVVPEPPTRVVPADEPTALAPGVSPDVAPASVDAGELEASISIDEVEAPAIVELDPKDGIRLSVGSPREREEQLPESAVPESISSEPVAEMLAPSQRIDPTRPEPAGPATREATVVAEPALGLQPERCEPGAGGTTPVAEAAPLTAPSAIAEPVTDRVAWTDASDPSGPAAIPAVVGPAEAAEARRIVALLAPIAPFDVIVQAVDGVMVFALTAPAVAQETTVSVAGLALPVLTERWVPWPVDQITLRGPDTALVLTPLRRRDASVLAAAAPRGGALALLEILSRRAAGDQQSPVGPAVAHVLPDGGRSLVQIAVPVQVGLLAPSLTAFGPVTPAVLRDAEGEGVLHFFLPAGEDVLAVGAIAQDLQAVMRKAAGSGAVFRTAVLRSGNTLLVIQPEQVGHDRSIVVVAGGAVTRPGLAYRQVERVSAILAQA
jgi:hypothetical protein